MVALPHAKSTGKLSADEQGLTFRAALKARASVPVGGWPGISSADASTAMVAISSPCILRSIRHWIRGEKPQLNVQLILDNVSG